MPVSVYFTQLILGVSAEEQFFIILLEFGWHHDGLIRLQLQYRSRSSRSVSHACDMLRDGRLFYIGLSSSYSGTF